MPRGNTWTCSTPRSKQRFKDTLRRLRDAGAEVIEVDLGDDFSPIAERMTWNIFFHETMPAISEFLLRRNFPVSFDEIYNDLRPEIKDMWAHRVLPNGPGFISPRPTCRRYLSIARNFSTDSARCSPTAGPKRFSFQRRRAPPL